MDCFDYVVVGSGPSGIAAARQLEGKGVCLVDVGEIQSKDFPYITRKSALDSGDTSSLLGESWEMLANLANRDFLHPKLRAPNLRYVMRGEPFRVQDGIGETILRGAGSYAAGGMSNAWGAQLLRYTDADLAEAGNWPFTSAVLEKYYVDLEAHIGISGQVDDMYDFLGQTSFSMMPPAPIVPAAQCLLSRYQLRKSKEVVSKLRLGRARLGVGTRPHLGYSECSFGETEFFTTGQPGIYTARRTLDELRAGGKIKYLGGYKLIAYREQERFVEIDLVGCVDNARRTIRARHLMLACGTVHTARLVLLNKNERDRSLPFIDHPPTLFPIFIPRMFGSKLPSCSFPVQLVATLIGAGSRDMISFYYPGAILWSDLLIDMPVPMEMALKMMSFLFGGMLVAQIWQASRPTEGNRLYLDNAAEIVIDYHRSDKYNRLELLLAELRALGAFSLRRLATNYPPGWGFHHAGTLPMRQLPGPYETHVDGRLWDSKRVRIIDGSVLPSLPAKNHSLTLMANAARIAEEVLRCGY